VSRIYGRLQSIFSGIPEEKRDGLASEEDDIILIDLAIDKEEESIQAYSEWADQAEDEEIRKLFAILVDFEKNHRKLLNNVKNYLESSGDWFMSEEQWIFDGG
jgi:rubrerythrin